MPAMKVITEITMKNHSGRHLITITTVPQLVKICLSASYQWLCPVWANNQLSARLAQIIQLKERLNAHHIYLVDKTVINSQCHHNLC